MHASRITNLDGPKLVSLGYAPDINGDVGRDSTKGHGTCEVHWVSHAMTYTGPVVLQFMYQLYPEITRIVRTSQVVCHKADAKKI